MVSTVSVDPKANVRTNILHDYENYTYNLELWALTIDGFNKLYDGILPGSEPDILNGAELLISNGGFSKNQNRSPSFPVDFVIDNLEIESIIGNRAEGKGADALNIKFDIIEPYSVTLLERLSEVVVRNGLGIDFKTLIYCMKIQFLGYDILGIPTIIEGATKYIPFTFLNMTFSINSKGAVYKCQGIPQKDMSLTMTDNIIPFHVELEGRTVGELLGAFKLSPQSGSARSDATTTPSSSAVTLKNLTKSLNDFEDNKVEQKSQKFANRYYFQLDPELYDAIVLDTKKAEDGQRPMSDISGSKGAAVAAGGRQGNITFDSTQGKFNAQSGTRVTDLLNNILKLTDFMKKQVNTTGNDTTKPVTTWKIFPKMKIKGYDTITNMFHREVTFVIKKYDYYGLPHPNMGQKPPPSGCIVKNYDYMYTGANRDVLDVQIEYKVAFFEVFNAMKDEMTQKANKGTGEAPKKDQTIIDNSNDRSQIKPGRLGVAGIGPEQTSGAATVDEPAIVVGELMNQLLDNAGDMIRLDLKIVGDPDWIQQDNVLYEVSKLPSGNKTLTNGSISYYDSITCFNFNFKAPLKDYDDTTGIFDVQTAKSSATFSGTYQVLKVLNNFARGKFTQKLDNVRVRIQDEKQVQKTAAPKDGAVLTTITPGPDNFSLDFTKYPDTGKPPR